jgi:hypothetical protein
MEGRTMVSAISSTQGASTYQATLAAWQQQFVQQLFQAAGGSGGTISETQFENFYNQFMGTTSQTTGTAQASTAAADQLFQQVNATGNGQMTLSQFATALQQMMAQKAQGHYHHHHHRSSVSGSTNNNSSANSTSSASNNSVTLLGQVLANANQSSTGQSTASQNNGGVEFTA